eukprot:g6218.t1
MDKHMSAITGIGISLECGVIFTAGRDKVIEIWDMGGTPPPPPSLSSSSSSSSSSASSSSSYAPIKTVPAYEAIEGLRILPASLVPGAKPNAAYFVTVGQKGAVRVWQYEPASDDALVSSKQHACKCIFTQTTNIAQAGISDVLVHAGLETLVSVTFDHELVFQHLTGRGAVSASSLRLDRDKVLVGYNDEVIDVKYLPRPASEADAASGRSGRASKMQVEGDDDSENDDDDDDDDDEQDDNDAAKKEKSGKAAKAAKAATAKVYEENKGNVISPQTGQKLTEPPTLIVNQSVKQAIASMAGGEPRESQIMHTK